MTQLRYNINRGCPAVLPSGYWPESLFIPVSC